MNSKTVFSVKLTSILKIVFAIILVSALCYISYSAGIQNSSEKKSIDPVKVISLTDITIAYAPEIKRIVFLDRKTGQVSISLSDSVSMAIFALKSEEVSEDYKSSLKNKVVK